MWIKHSFVGFVIALYLATVITQVESESSNTSTKQPLTKTHVTTTAKSPASPTLPPSTAKHTVNNTLTNDTKSNSTTVSTPGPGPGSKVSPEASNKTVNTSTTPATTVKQDAAVPVKDTTVEGTSQPNKNVKTEGPPVPPSTTVKPNKPNAVTPAPKEGSGTNTKPPSTTQSTAAAGPEVTVNKTTPRPSTAVQINDTSKQQVRTTVASPDGNDTDVSERNTTGTSAPVTGQPGTSAPPAKTNATIASARTTKAATQKVSNTTSSTQPTSSTANKSSTIKASTAAPTPAPTAPSIPSTKAPENKSTSTEKPGSVKPGNNSTSASPATSQKPGPTTSKGPSVTPSPVPQTTGKVQSTPAPTQDKLYINEIMVDRNGGFQTIELLMTSAVNLSHYAMVIIDGGTYTKQVYSLDKAGQKTDNVLTIPINSTLHVMKDHGTGIAVYDTNMVNVSSTDWNVGRVGLMDSLVIGKTYDVSDNLSKIITDGDYPFVVNPALFGKQKTISRCSDVLSKTADMFLLTNSSLGQNNADTCSAKMSMQKRIVLKINAHCHTIKEDLAREIMKYVAKEMNKKCSCGITQQHIQDIEVDCCEETLLKIEFVIPSKTGDSDLTDIYKAYIDSAPNIPLKGQNYQADKKCDDYKACCNQYQCCQQPKPQTQDSTEKNVRVTVAAVVSCLLLFMIIVVIVIIYMKRKKTVNYQFRMSRLREDDDDGLMMDHPDADDFVGGQEATFDIKA